MKRARQISSHASLRRQILKVLNLFQDNPDEFDTQQLGELRQWFKLIDSVLTNEVTTASKKELKELHKQIDELTEKMGITSSLRIAK